MSTPSPMTTEQLADFRAQHPQHQEESGSNHICCEQYGCGTVDVLLTTLDAQAATIARLTGERDASLLGALERVRDYAKTRLGHERSANDGLTPEMVILTTVQVSVGQLHGMLTLRATPPERSEKI